MKFISNYLFLPLLLLPLLFSCNREEIIPVELSDAPAQLVIEGRVTDEAIPYSVRISRSIAFDEANDFPGVSGAQVIIRDDAGRIDTLLEKEPGLYETSDALPGVSGRTYTLQVWVAGASFVASSTMPALVPLEALNALRVPFTGSDALVMAPVFTDPAGPGNYYQFVQSRNGVRQPFIFVTDDRNNDGARISSLLLAPEADLMPGDTVTIEMRSIDRATYKYLVALDASRGDGPNASVPANPDNNFAGACLGYFAAYTVQRQTVILE